MVSFGAHWRIWAFTPPCRPRRQTYQGQHSKLKPSSLGLEQYNGWAWAGPWPIVGMAEGVSPESEIAKWLQPARFPYCTRYDHRYETGNHVFLSIAGLLMPNSNLHIGSKTIHYCVCALFIISWVSQLGPIFPGQHWLARLC